MDTERRKKLIEHLRAYDPRSFLAGIDNLHEQELKDLVFEYFSMPGQGHIFPYDAGGRRARRNSLFSSLQESFERGGYHGVACIFRDKLKITQSAEALFDEIKIAIDLCDISKKSPVQRLWSHIVRLEEEFFRMSKKAQRDIQRLFQGGNLSTLPVGALMDEDGKEYSPDFELESMVVACTSAIKLLSHQQRWFEEGSFPKLERAEVSDDLIFQAGSISGFALSWRSLEDFSNRALFFGGEIYVREGDSIQADAREAGVKKSYHWDKDFTKFEVFDFISARRAIDIETQDFFSIVLDDAFKTEAASEEGIPSDLDEFSALNSLSNMYSQNFFEVEEEVLGITVQEWVKSYSCIKRLAKGEGSKPGFFVHKDELVQCLSVAGISGKKANSFLGYAAFNKDSVDLYNSPLINVGEDLFYLVAPVIASASLTMICSAAFSDVSAVFGKKGKGFEKEIIEFLKNQKVEAESFKFKRDDSEFEYDVVFVLDRRVFVCECKNRSIPRWRPVRSARFKSAVDDAVAQVKRLVDGLLRYPEVFREKFGREIEGLEVIPVIINCQPFSFAGDFCGVYISDRSSFKKFFRKSIDRFEVNGGSKVENTEILYEFWSGDHPTSEDLLAHFEMPIQVEVYLNNFEKRYSWGVASNTVAFTFPDISADLRRGVEIKFGGNAPVGGGSENQKVISNKGLKDRFSDKYKKSFKRIEKRKRKIVGKVRRKVRMRLKKKRRRK
jgi:hypothetical protein